jgi:hypothetical protein
MVDSDFVVMSNSMDNSEKREEVCNFLCLWGTKVYKVVMKREVMWAPAHFAPMEVTHFYIPNKKIVITKLGNYFVEKDKKTIAEIIKEIKKPKKETKIEKLEIERSALDYILNELSRLETLEKELDENRKKVNELCEFIFGELQAKYKLTELGKKVMKEISEKSGEKSLASLV